MNSFISEKALIDNNRLDSDGDYARVKMYAGEEFRAYLEKTERTILSEPGYSILVGSEVYFGRQPDGQKPITWVVLEKTKTVFF